MSLSFPQDFTPEEGRYDLIWCQWVLGHLTDGEEDMTSVTTLAVGYFNVEKVLG